MIVHDLNDHTQGLPYNAVERCSTALLFQMISDVVEKLIEMHFTTLLFYSGKTPAYQQHIEHQLTKVIIFLDTND